MGESIDMTDLQAMNRAVRPYEIARGVERVWGEGSHAGFRSSNFVVYSR